MSGSNEKREMEKLQKALSEMTPARRAALDKAFQNMRNGIYPSQPEMQQMHFGGYCVFDENRKQVELEGEFSKQDLLRIALVME